MRVSAEHRAARAAWWFLVIAGLLAATLGATARTARADEAPKVAEASTGATVTLDTGFVAAPVAGGSVYAQVVRADGKILIGGDFASVGGVSRNGIALLSANGTLDATFNPGSGVFGRVTEVVQLGDRVVIAGPFTVVNGTTRGGLAALNADGTLDAGFNPGSGFASPMMSDAAAPHSMVVQAGKLVVGGDFSRYNGATANGIVRVNADGSRDATFVTGSGFDMPVTALALQADNKILAGGTFTTFAGANRSGVARLAANGGLDATFDPGTGFAGEISNGVEALIVQSDGKVLAGGNFQTFDTDPRSGIARLNAEGTLDTTFDPGSGFAGDFLPGVTSLSLQSDGKVVVGGDFTSFNGTARIGIARVASDGSLDATLNPGGGFAGSFAPGVLSVTVQGDGKVLASGTFTSYNGTGRIALARLGATGTLDSGFTVQLGQQSGFDGAVTAVALQSDGKVVVAGSFTSFRGTARSGIARLNSDGTLDSTFDPGTGFDSGPQTLVVQPDGRILAGGVFRFFNEVARNGVARLTANGALDTSFDPGTGFASDWSPAVAALALQSDGKAVVGGGFTTFNGTARNGVARLNSSGSLDGTFNPGTGFAGEFVPGVTTIALQANGQALVGGDFTSFDGTARAGIARLATNGSLDASFAPGAGFGGDFGPGVSVLAVQPDGKILVGGDFSTYNGTARQGIARLGSNAALDSGFAPGTGFDGRARSLVLQPDGKILAGGEFAAYNGAARSGIVRIAANGALDAAFNPGVGFAGGFGPGVDVVAQQADGKILVGGGFNSFDNSGVLSLARVLANPSAPTGVVGTPGGGRATVQFTAPANPGGTPISNYEYSTDDGATWSVRSPASASSPVVITGLTNGTAYPIRLRAVNGAGVGPASAAVSVTPEAGASALVPVVPVRVADTRPGQPVAFPVSKVPVPAGGVLAVPIAGLYGVPGNAGGVSINVTAVSPSGAGFLTVFPCGAALPNVSSVNYVAGQVVPNAVVSGVAVDGTVCVFSSAQADVIVDLNGWYPAGAGFTPIAPVRAADTRGGQPVAFPPNKVPIPAGGVLAVPLAGQFGIPSDAGAVALNVTAVAPAAGGFLTVFPCGAAQPNASSVNYVAGQVVPNAVISGVGTGGKVCVFSSAAANVIVDVNGWFAAPPGFNPLAPVRIADTRPGQPVAFPATKAPVPAGGTLQVPVAGQFGVPADAGAAVLNVTAVGPSAGGFLTVYPCGSAQPNSSNVNYVAGQVVPNMVQTGIGTSGRICVFSSASTNLVIDINGWYPAG